MSHLKGYIKETEIYLSAGFILFLLLLQILQYTKTTFHLSQKKGQHIIIHIPFFEIEEDRRL